MKNTLATTLLGLAALSTVAHADLRRAATPIAGKYLVVMKDGVPAAKGVALAGRHGGAADRTLGRVGVVAVSLSEAAALAIASDPDVAFVEEDGLQRISTTQTDATWGLDRIDQAALPLDQQYTFDTRATNVTAYVLDTGIRATHQEFTGRLLPGFTSIDDGQGTNDCQGHGTHVAGTIGGTVLGVAKGVALVPVRVLGCDGSGTTSGAIAGLDWVATNARLPAVANMSLGGSGSDAQDAAVRRVIATGVTMVVAAGNDNQDACTKSPAREPLAITVAASDTTDRRAAFSNYGTCVDVFAPGVDIFSAAISGDDRARLLSGTSMASPHVAGVVALYLATHPTATPAEVTQALLAATVPNLITDPAGSPNRLVQARFGGGGGGEPGAPTVAIVSPRDGARVSPFFDVDATATDADLVSLDLYVDGDLVDTADASEVFSVAATRGVHEVSLVATDAAGNATTTAITVEVVYDLVDDELVLGPGASPEVIGGCSTGTSPTSLVLGLGLLGVAMRRRRC